MDKKYEVKGRESIGSVRCRSHKHVGSWANGHTVEIGV